ncbi:MAG: FAD-dependent oxidoreductase [Desulfosoma sp.]
MKDPLFQPVVINKMEVPNRIVMPAMHLNMAKKFQVTDRLVDFYAERARGGAGLICVGYATVDELSGSPGNIGAHDDVFIEGLARLSAAIKENGSLSAVQLNHAGRYNPSILMGGKQPVAPSAVPSRLTGETPRELTVEEIQGIVDRFAQAARRVKQAGFDAVEILCGTGYLISEFLSPLTNKRTDQYGGDLNGRMRFGLEVICAVRDAVGPDFPILVRTNGNDFMPGGVGRKELAIFAQALVGHGADALNINVGWHEARVPQIISDVPRGAFAYLARSIKERVSVPVIAGHRINDPRVARELIADDLCDMVAMGRSLIADPRLPEKARTGREHEIVHCIACAQGCFDNLFEMKSVECLCNPLAGHERDRQVVKAPARKKVLVAGGGPAGMSAALAAHDRGHDVVLYEKSDRLGGQLWLAAAPPGRFEFSELARDLATQLAVRGVRVVLNTEVTEAVIREEKPDEVVLATGAEPITPPVPGSHLSHVVQAWDILAGRAFAGRRVVVIGGGAVGVETALYLAQRGTLSGEALKFLALAQAEDPQELFRLAVRGTKEIILVEMLDAVGKDLGRSTRWAMLQNIAVHGVKVYKSTKALEITPEGVQVQTPEGETRYVPCDTVVLAAGSRSYNPLEEKLREKGLSVHVVGDAARVGKAFDAVHQGFQVGRAL